MQPRDWRLRIEDMLEAAAQCRLYVADINVRVGVIASHMKWTTQPAKCG